MGRYIHGDEGFEYKYSFGEQPSNLCHLAAASGAGVQKLFLKVETSEDELIFAPELVPVSRFGNGARVFERWAKKLRLAMVDSGVDGLRGFLEDPDALDGEPDELTFTASVVWQMTRDDQPVLLQWVNSYLPPSDALTLDLLASEYGNGAEMSSALVERARLLHRTTLAHGLLPYLGFHLLGFTCAKQIGDFGAEDGDPLFSTDIWKDGQFHAGESTGSEADGAGFELDMIDKLIQRSAAGDGILLTPTPRTKTKRGSSIESSDEGPEERASRWLHQSRAGARSAQQKLLSSIGVFVVAPPSEAGLWGAARAIIRNSCGTVEMPSKDQIEKMLASLVDLGERGAATRALRLLQSQGLPADAIDLIA